ncbi:MAG TPA: hypothetical protein VJC10_02825 [Patescibacteria group bacterium]|nr:hypothetical protein [Patescibacteria group bacterium]
MSGDTGEPGTENVSDENIRLDDLLMRHFGRTDLTPDEILRFASEYAHAAAQAEGEKYRTPEVVFEFDDRVDNGRQQIDEILTKEMIFKPEERKNLGVTKKLVGTTTGNSIAAYLYNGIAVAPPENDYWFNADVQGDGKLFLSARLLSRAKDGSYVKHPLMPNLTRLVELSIQYFHSMGKDIKAIQGAWNTRVTVGGRNPIPNTNFTIFREQQLLGKTPQEAALMTPTGKVASRLGFSNVIIQHNTKRGAAALFTKPQ